MSARGEATALSSTARAEPVLPFTRREAAASARSWLVGTMLALLGIGLLMAASTSFVRDKLRPDEGTSVFLAHGVKVVLALLVCFAATRVRARHLYRAAPWAWCAAVLLLGVVLVFAEPVNGARRWLELGPITFQPSEFARVATMLAIAAWMASLGERADEIGRGLLVPLGLAAVPAVLVAMEPDYGSSVYLVFMATLVLWLAGTRVWTLAGGFAIVMGGLFVYAWDRLGHVRERIEGFGDPPVGSQVWQSLLALGHGGLFGVGVGGGPSKWGYLPEADNDFVLAVIGEELGLLGTASVLILFVLYLVHGVRLVLGLRSLFAAVVGAGLLIQVAVQAAVNIAVVTASVPPKGISLPFVSTGGSSILVLCASTGLLLGLSRDPKEDPLSEPRSPSSAEEALEAGS